MTIQKDMLTRHYWPSSKFLGYSAIATLGALCMNAIAISNATAEPLVQQTTALPTINSLPGGATVQDNWTPKPVPAADNFLPVGEMVEADAAIPQSEPSLLLTQQTSETDDAPEKFGKAGTQRLYIQGAAASDFDDETLGLVGVGASHFFHDNHSVNLELNALAFDQPGDNAVGLNLNFLVRSHWIRGENWSIYIDGGAGIIGTTNDVPSEGSSFNFTPQVGGGATFKINDKQRLMTGLRYYHVSNADTFESNPGLDALMGYVGLNFPL